MATAEEYARWIVENSDKAGTPEFETVAAAYRATKSAPKQATGSANNDLASQAGLFARYGLKAAAAVPSMMADAATGVVNKAQDLTLGEGKGFRFQQTMPALDRALTRLGVPEPDTPLQRIVGKGVEVGTGAGMAAKAANLAAQGATGATAEVLRRLGADVPMQVAAGAGSGLAGEQSKEAGGEWLSQFGSSILGGLTGAGLAGATKSVATRLGGSNFTPADVERTITVALKNQGIDPATITPAMKTSLMRDAMAALKLNKGSLDDAALARLADYRRLGLEPTKRRLTLDPFDVTQELNAEKVAAATGTRSARLPQISQDNNKTLLGAVEGFNPMRDRTATGGGAVAPIFAKDAAMKGTEKGLYDAAREMAGGDIPLAPGPVMTPIWQSLDKNLKTPFVPAEIANFLNKISNKEMPFDVNTVDVLKTMIAAEQRSSSNGNVRAALSIIRDGLDNAPWTPANNPAFGGGQVTNAATAAAMREGDSAPGTLMKALNDARAAAFERRSWQRSAPGIEKALDGATPETFIKNNIVSKSAGFDDVAKLALEINRDPAAKQAVRSSIVQELKDAAIGVGNETQTANFSGRQWLAGLANVGDKKLRLFFDAEELEQLKAIGRTGSIETFQPRGSAVNNSNTAAGVAGLIQGITRYAKPVLNKIPFGQDGLIDPMNRLSLSFMERGATRIPRGLLAPMPEVSGGLLDSVVLPGFIGSSLLAP